MTTMNENDNETLAYINYKEDNIDEALKHKTFDINKIIYTLKDNRFLCQLNDGIQNLDNLIAYGSIACIGYKKDDSTLINTNFILYKSKIKNIYNCIYLPPLALLSSIQPINQSLNIEEFIYQPCNNYNNFTKTLGENPDRNILYIQPLASVYTIKDSYLALKGI